MPNRLPIACPRCGQPDCQKHSARKDERKSAWRRGYNTEWQKLRRMVLAHEPLCRHCRARGLIEPAVDVHHEKPVRFYPEHRLDPSVLTPLCHACHAKIQDV